MKNQSVQITKMPTLVDRKADDTTQQLKATEVEIQAWLVSYMADLLQVHTDAIDVTIPFYRYGLDSVVIIGLAGDLQQWLGCELDPTLMYDYPTIEALVQYLGGEFQEER
ncbi:MAG: acyl carrier protein [Chroococcidiopsidaceae cyanobacterium CP_BM_ER_R8_30]|nr:acyl carrier protein [Chroococcidiopsidaceae cyanobacterium CP_BM_ER_R8_30]